MAQDSNSSTHVPWGQSSAPATQPWWREYGTVPALLGHIAIMLTTVSALTLLNLVLNPGTWWSLAILVLWFTFVVIHALGIVSINLLLDESDDDTAPPRVHAEPHGPETFEQGPVHGPAQETQASPASDWQAPKSPEDHSWPSAADSETESESFKPLDLDEDSSKNERVPWRAATDIAWLRRRGRDGDDATEANKDASS